MKPQISQVPGTYTNKRNNSIVITKELKPGDIGYDLGFRFMDSALNTYTSEGKWSLVKKTDRDLVL